MKNNLYYLYLAEGINVIPYPILDSMFMEIYNLSFAQWQKREDLDFPDEQIKDILSKRYTAWEP